MRTPHDETRLRESMINLINSRRPTTAARQFDIYVRHGQKVVSAHTLYQAVLANLLSFHVERAEQLFECARHSRGFSVQMEGDFLRDKANLYTLRGDYDEALRCLATSDKWLTDPSKQEANRLMRAKVKLYQGDSNSLIELRKLQLDVVERVRLGGDIDEQYARNITWWFMLAAASFGEGNEAAALAQTVREGLNFEVRPTEQCDSSFLTVKDSSFIRRTVAGAILLLESRDMLRGMLSRMLIAFSRR